MGGEGDTHILVSVLVTHVKSVRLVTQSVTLCLERGQTNTHAGGERSEQVAEHGFQQGLD